MAPAPTLALVTLTITCAGFLALVTPATWAAATAPGAGPGALLAGLADLAGWVVGARLAVTALGVLLAAVPGACGRLGRRVATAWSPALTRGLVRSALGATLAAGPMLAGTAAFADQPAYPTLDRVVVMTSGAVAQPAQAAGATEGGHHAAKPPAAEPAAHHAAVAGHVVVRPGDTLWGIAATHLRPGASDAEIAAAWPRWYAANRATVGPDPGRIRPGTRLVPPAATG